MRRRKVFLNYRREDTAADTGHLRHRLSRWLRRCEPFMDVVNISSGTDYVRKLREEVANCEVLLAVIGPAWLDIRDAQGRRRLDNPEDPVRVEIAAALEREIPVIPVLIEDTEIPSAKLLPADLGALAGRNALHLRHASFDADFERLFADIKLHVRAARKKVREANNAAAAKTREQCPQALWEWFLGAIGGGMAGGISYALIASLRPAVSPSESRLIAAVLTLLLGVAIVAAIMLLAAAGRKSLLRWPMPAAAAASGFLSAGAWVLAYALLASAGAGNYLPDDTDVRLGLLWFAIPLLFLVFRLWRRNGPHFWRDLLG